MTNIFTLKIIFGRPGYLAAIFLAGVLSITLLLGDEVDAATQYITTTGQDSNTCTQSAPCFSFNRAYAASNPGDTIEVSGGNYASQHIFARSIGPDPVIFRPVTGQTVSIGHLEINASYVEIRDMAVSGINVKPSDPNALPSATSYVVLRNIKGKYMVIIAEHVSVIGGDYGGFNACDTNYPEDVIQVWQTYPSGKASSYITFDGVRIHDVSDNNNLCAGTAGSGRHVDCMQILGGHHITVRNSIFYNCATSDIIARPYKDTLNDLTIENNFFQDVSNPGASLNLGASGDTYGGVNVVRHNFIGSFSAAFSSGNLQAYGNIMRTGACQSGVSYSNNVFMTDGWGAVCGTKAKNGTPSFVGPIPAPKFNNGIIPNFHLAANDTIAKDAGDPARYPETDIDGERRFAGLAPDAGADEIGSTPAQYCGDGACNNNETCSSCSADCGQCQTTPGCTDCIEAESGILASPMAKGNDVSCSGGQYIETNTAESGTANYSFTITTPGTYKLTARVFAATVGNDSFYFKLDNNLEDTWDMNPAGDPAMFNKWIELDLNKRGNGTFDKPQYQPYNAYLSAGTHTLIFRGREAGTRLDWFKPVIISTTAKKGDLNNDNKVDVTDLGMLLGNWNTAACPEPCRGDLNQDGKVDVTDLGVLLGNWG